MAIENLKIVKEDLEAAQNAFRQALDCHFGRNGKEVDYKKALVYYRMAVSSGSAAALNNIAVMYERGDAGLSKNNKESLELFQIAAERGDANGAFNAYIYLLNGTAGIRDEKRAFVMLKRSAELSHPKGCCIWGGCLENGMHGTEKDLKAAHKMYLTSWMKDGNAEACYHVARFAMYGLDGNKADVHAGYLRFEEAARKGHVKAMVELSAAYNEGRGVAVDKSAGWNWLLKAAESGDMGAQFDVGMAFDEQGLTDEALKWFLKAAAQGHEGAMAFRDGIEAKRREKEHEDKEREFELVIRDAEAGRPYAQYQLGLAYLNGDHVRRSARQAVDWFSSAADHGEKHALSELGWCYLTGTGVPKANPGRAFEFFSKAAGPRSSWSLSQNKRALKGLYKCYKEGLGVERDKTKASMLELYLFCGR